MEGELPKDESGVDVPLIWEIVRKAVREMPNFEMVEDVVLSTFSFAKYLMWKDLATRTETLKQSPFVKHLIDRPRENYASSAAFLRPDQIDEKIKPSDLFMPLSSDSSQIVAVYASSQGGDFVLEGPPGTGKSQTIANIIAHNLAMGRKVLFVSEKMTALEVVYKRLCEKGLGDFCLELHSSKANKREVLEQLGKSWRNRNIKSQTQWHEQANRLEKIRNNLNGLVKALHRPGATGISPRMAIGRSVNYSNDNRLKLDWTGGLNNDRIRSVQELNEFEEIAKRLGQNYAELNENDRKAFSNITRTEWSNAWQSNVVDLARLLIQAIDKLSAAASDFSAKSGLPAYGLQLSSLRPLSNFAGSIPLAASNNLEFALGSDTSIFGLIDEALAVLKTYTQEKARLSCKYPDNQIMTAPLEIWWASWVKASRALWPVKPFQQMLITRKVRQTLALSSSPFLGGDLPILENMCSLRRKFEELATKFPQSVQWRGLETEPHKVAESVVAGKKLRENMVNLAKNPTELANIRNSVRSLCVDSRDMIQAGTPIAQAAAIFSNTFSVTEKAISGYFKEIDGPNTTDVDLTDLRNQLQSIIDLQPRINAWCRWQSIRKEAAVRGLDVLIKALENGAIEPSNIVDAFKTAYCEWLAVRLIDERPELRTFSAVAHEDFIQEFRKLDQNLSDLSVDYIRAKLSGDIPAFEGDERPAGYKVLSRELQKKMRHMPVRKLVEDIGDVLTTLTPCLLMSPLSVSQFLAADSKLFDVVVFDEASQITVWDAIGAIARGKNVIVVGDPKQMPPTNFFDRAATDGDADGDDDNGTEDLESILDEGLAAGVKLHRLTGHYRSRHESLIAFSNHRYYDSELMTYPSSETKESAVSFRNVKGIYQRGKGRTNPIEAKAVVGEIIRRLKDPILKDLSIGVVTFNSEQKKLIEDLLDEARTKDPELEEFFESGASDEQVVVKNLETVQGHERDVVLLSIGYGPDTPEAKTMPMTFGPLNRKGGERRLNVAITRAKSEMIIFASFEPGMIDLTRTSALAVRDLRHYLEFAQRGPIALAEAIKSVGGESEYDSDFEKAVAEGLRKRNWIVHTQIGVSKFRIDLGIVHPHHPNKYLAGVECDGAAYHSSPSAKDRDRVRHSILENLGWTLLRIWSTDYFIDPQRILNKVNDQLQLLLTNDRAARVAIPQPPQDNKENELPEEKEDTINDSSENYITQEQSSDALTFLNEKNLSPEKFYEAAYLTTIKAYSCELIDQLGPITFKHLCEKIARAHGFQRTGTQIKSTVWSAISKVRQSGKTKDGQTLLWPEGVSLQETYNYRGLLINGHPREWRDVPYPEKLNLAYQIKSSGPHEDAASVMAAKIGLGRLHGSTREELEELLSSIKENDAA